MRGNQVAMVKQNQNLKKAFCVTYNFATVGVIACALLLVFTGVSLKLWQDINAEWFRCVGLTSFGLAFISIMLGFVSQNANLYVQHIARKSGNGTNFFRQYQHPSLLRQIVRHFSSRQHVKPARAPHARMNARSYRRAPRPAFAYASCSGHSCNEGDPDPESSSKLHTVKQTPSATKPFWHYLLNNAPNPRHAPAIDACPQAREVI